MKVPRMSRVERRQLIRLGRRSDDPYTALRRLSQRVEGIADPAQVAVLGNVKLELSCGTQQLRRVKVEYFPKANAKMATKGEVATIEFQ